MHDLIIIGAGPAGLSAAINAASEGLSVLVLDNGTTLGGQAKESHGIENYPGFPDGITGDELMRKLVIQAGKFETKFICPVSVAGIKRGFDGENTDVLTVLTDDYHEYPARSVLIATGLQYRRLHAEGISDLLGRGVSYGMPVGAIPRSRTCSVTIVGGANSAGQAVLKLANNPLMKINMVIRKTIDAQMSQYAVERIRNLDNVHLYEHAEVTELFQRKSWLHSFRIKNVNGDQDKIINTDFMFIFIGAIPKTIWMKNTIGLDKENYVKTGRDNTENINPLPYETSMKGVFAAGDVRSTSVKRIAASSGEGSSVVPYIHRYLASLA